MAWGVDYVPEGQITRRGFGVAYCKFTGGLGMTAVMLPIPINLVVRWLRQFYLWKLKYPTDTDREHREIRLQKSAYELGIRAGRLQRGETNGRINS